MTGDTGVGWEPIMNGWFLAKEGPAYDEEVEACQAKLCFTSTDKPILHAVLDEIAQRPDCWYVKHDIEPKAGMFRGRAFLIDEPAVGALWALYKSHPRLHCGVQDDRFTMRFRPIEALFGHLEAERGGRIQLAEAPWPGDVVDPAEAVHQCALSVGLASQRAHWQSIEPAMARAVVSSLLSRRLGDHEPLLSPIVAKRHGVRFVSRAGSEAVFFTVPDLAAAHVREEKVQEFVSLTDADFDAGVASVERQRISIFWVAD